MKTILLTKAELSARFAEKKDEKPIRHTIPAGTHLTDALLKKFGINADTLESLKDRGHVVEANAHVVSDDAATADALAAEKARADAAEAKVADLTKQLAEATKAKA